MTSSKNNSFCTLIDRFTLMERIVMRVGWYGFMAVGTYGIYKQAPAWAAVYVVFALLGFALVVLPGLCVHCPYPSKYNTCLFLPSGLVNRFYPYKGPEMSWIAKFSVFSVMAGMVIMPNFWLVSDLPILVFFWLLGLPTVAVFPLHYCKRCRHTDCPMNRAASVTPELK
jgi:hypothetical protein